MESNTNDHIDTNNTLSILGQKSLITFENSNTIYRNQLDKIIKKEERLMVKENRCIANKEYIEMIPEINKSKQLGSKIILKNDSLVYLGKKSHSHLNQYFNVYPEIETFKDNGYSINILVHNNITVVNYINQISSEIQNKYITRDHNDHFDKITYEKKNCTQLLNTINSYQFNLQKKYWDKWRNFASKKKKTLKCRSKYDGKIDSFLTKIQEKINERQSKKNKEKKLPYCVAPKQIKTIYERQQTKIDNQKKLLEKQQKEIERLKIQQFKLETEKAMLENQRLSNQILNKAEKGLKLKDASQKQLCLAVPTPTDILNRMEIRAIQRQAKWEAIKERQKIIEQEKYRKKQEQEEKSLKEQMELKRRKLFEAREKLKLKKIEESKQQMERDILRKKIKIADEFYSKLLIRRSFYAFQNNLSVIRLKMQNALDFYNHKLIITYFNNWRLYSIKCLDDKVQIADQHYKKKLKIQIFSALYMLIEDNRRQKQVAEDWNNFKILEFWFKQWLALLKKIKKDLNEKMLIAENHHDRCTNNGNNTSVEALL
ncbi:RING finger protein PFF0165c isoform X2 [Daktulosphaira vitifoliae]|uniref:RING finger protein PFF0165c isoform X2 n=1 Tax=Daktulosphaira vitifoliae TaxID=58002 RepID=UPI0021A9BBE8|nr:RING finger protein PFF0165c isoform X2 [Daktulosphaira vitifoliae]